MMKLDCICALKALGELNRMRLLRLLLTRQMSVGELAHKLGMSEYNASKHLRILREAGLVETQRQGRQHLYAVPKELHQRLQPNDNVLNLDCCTFRFDKLPQ